MNDNHNKLLNDFKNKYNAGFTTNIKSICINPGLSTDIIKKISQKTDEPTFLLRWRLKAYKCWLKMSEPVWGKVLYNQINYNKIIYHSTPLKKPVKNLNEIDPQLLNTYQRLGIPIIEQKRLSGIAVDAIFDSTSVGTTFQKQLLKLGVLFCSFSDAVKKYPEIIIKYLGSVVSYSDNFFAALNSSVFSDGSFCYIPKNIHCPIELSTYFRINTVLSGQFERTLIIANTNSYASYLEGCSAPIRDENQLHAAIVEIITLDNAEIKYSTIQNWYTGNNKGIGGIYNFVTKRGICYGNNSKISWIQIETGSAITWKYPSVILRGNNSSAEFYSISLISNYQQADTGTKMFHIGNNTNSITISKGISNSYSQNTYRSIININKFAQKTKIYSQCDSLLLGKNSGSHTFPYFNSKNMLCNIEHEASTSKINEEKIFYCMQRGLNQEEAVSIIINGFCKYILKKLPTEFTIEAQKLLEINLWGN